jgi:peptidoglycan/LPS O-acetylase OafA/YrhL
VAALIQGLPVTAGMTGTPSAWRFLAGDWFLVIQQYDIGGLLDAAPHEPSFNGALWTLTYEGFCYMVVAALGVVGLLRRRRWVVPALAVAIFALTVLHENGVVMPIRAQTLRLTLMFALGAVAYLYADRIPMRASLGVLALALVVAGAVAFPDNYRLLGAVPMAYLVFWLATAGTRFVSLRVDLSYGIYIYHWPVIQLLTLTSLVWLPDWAFVPIAIFAVVPVAVVSWFLVEKPALAHKHSPFPDRVADLLARPLRSLGIGAASPTAATVMPNPRSADDDAGVLEGAAVRGRR